MDPTDADLRHNSWGRSVEILDVVSSNSVDRVGRFSFQDSPLVRVGSKTCVLGP